MTKLDRRRKYYLVLDTETATLPYAHSYDGNGRKKIAIAKPLIYDIGWKIIDVKGNVYKTESFVISEIFSVPAIFNTAYYASKRPHYIDRLNRKETSLVNWDTAAAELLKDLRAVESVGAYNSMFDYKKAIPFTELYIRKLYSNEFYEWEKMQNEFCEKLVHSRPGKSTKPFNQHKFVFRGEEFCMFDIWGLSCEHLLNNDEYRQTCLENGWVTESGKYYKTSAEVAFRYITKEHDFDEMHMAIDDVEIEKDLMVEVFKKTKHDFERGIIYFPFKILGEIQEGER